MKPCSHERWAVRYVRRSAALGAVLAGWLLPALAQAQQTPPVDLTGVWSTTSLDTLDNPAWDIVGQFSCRCAAETYGYLDTLLYDPANDHLSADEILEALETHTSVVIADRLTETGRATGEAFDLADDPAIQCERFGAFRTVLHADPISSRSTTTASSSGAKTSRWIARCTWTVAGIRPDPRRLRATRSAGGKDARWSWKRSTSRPIWRTISSPFTTAIRPEAWSATRSARTAGT